MEFAARLKIAGGVHTPIFVRDAGEDTFELIAGERRTRSSQINGWETVPAKVFPKDTPVGEGSNINIYDAKSKMVKYGLALINESRRTATAEFRFDQPGVYTIKPYQDWNTGFGPYRITVGK